MVKIEIRRIKNIEIAEIQFRFPSSGIILVTGRNGAGKTTISECFGLLSDPNIFEKTSAEKSLTSESKVIFNLEGFEPFEFVYNPQLRALDSRDRLPAGKVLHTELAIPHGERFRRYSRIAKFDADLRSNIAASDYRIADELIDFLNAVYASKRFEELRATRIKNDTYYFLLKENDYYIREDHFSSGEYFLIQLHRVITSGARLIVVDELDVALDAVAQSRLLRAIKPILAASGSHLIVISHSLATMKSAEEDCLYYLEGLPGRTVLQSRSYGYVKADLFGFEGYDKYILVEDEILEQFIEYLLLSRSMRCHYRYAIIGAKGANQLEGLLEKNDRDHIFAGTQSVLGVVDDDIHSEVLKSYCGPTKIVSTGINDIEKFIYTNRSRLFPQVDPPPRKESRDLKKASKKYWNWLVSKQGFSSSDLYEIVASEHAEETERFVSAISRFLGRT